MVARPGQQFLSFASGELAPEFHARRDVKNFYSGFAAARNMEANPLGGGRQSPRTRYRGRAGRTVTIGAAATLGAPTGSITAGTVILTADLGANAALCGADITVTAAAPVTGGVRVELQDAGGAWSAIASAIDVGTSSVGYRICIPPGAPVTGRRARLVAAATVSITAATVRPLTEGATTTVRFLTHVFSTSLSYVMTVAAGHADIWRAGAYVGAVALPHTADQLPRLQQTQRAASMLLWHKDVAPHEVRRNGADHQWTQATRTWLAIPEVDYGGTYTVTPEKWSFYFRWVAGGTGGTALHFHSMTITINGETTAAIAIPSGGGGASGTDWSLFFTRVTAAVEALASVDVGLTLAQTGDYADSASFTIEFTGGTNPGQQFAVNATIITGVTANIAVNVGRLTRGKKGGEAVMSVTRGWPRTGIYAEDRLIMGGFNSRSDAYLGSRTGEYFDLNAELETAASGFVFSLNADGSEDITRFLRGAHFIIFTDTRHYYIANPPFNRTQPPNQRTSDTPGIQPNCEPLEIEGRIFYVSNDGSQLMTAQYSDVTQKYDTQPISLLANHLIRDIRSNALQRSSSDTVANRLFMVRGDGGLTLGGIIRNQDVTGFFPWTTDGQVLDVCVDGSRTAWLMVKRTVAGVDVVTFEQLTLDTCLDCTVAISQAASTAVTGLGIHEGATVWVKADGDYLDRSFVVTGGAITLPWAASSIEVGRWQAPVLTLLPMVRELNERNVVQRPGRVHTVKINARAVSSLAIAANGRPVFNVALAAPGDPGTGPYPPVSGMITVTGLTGWQVGTSVTLTQLYPGPFDIRDITVEGRL
jgi:hypothetical protein